MPLSMATAANQTEQTQLVPLRRMARELDVPEKWLRQECAAGHIPSIRAGSKFLVNPGQVLAVLITRLAEQHVKAENGARR